jgi:Lrp/AsnC family transcriptional regulator, leucine-responsive regulatory protein
MAAKRGNPAVTHAPPAIDAFDVEILNLVQENNQLTTQEIAEKVALSASAVQRRLRRLREEKAIVADVSVIAPAVAGNRVTLIVEVSLERDQLHLREEFENTARRLPEVAQCYVVTGRADFVLILNMASMEEYGEFTKRVFFANPNVKQFYAAVVTSRVKFSTRVQLPSTYA